MKLKLKKIIEKPEKLFLIIGSVFGLLSVFMMPALTAPDEGLHFWISYGMFSRDKQIPKDLLISAESSVKAVNSGEYAEEIFEDKANLNNDSVQLNANKVITLNQANESQPVSSFDISRLPQAIGILIGRLVYPSIGVMTTLGRLVNLAVYLSAIYFIIKSVRYGKLSFAFIALFPMLIQQAGSLSYDVINIVTVFAWVALMINLFTQKTAVSKKQLLLLIGIAVALILTKRSNILLLAFIPFLPLVLYKNTRPFVFLSRRLPFTISKQTLRRAAAVIAGLLVLVALAFLYKYTHAHGVTIPRLIEVMFNTFFRPEVNTQLDPIITSGLVGNFGWLWYRLPEWLVILHLMVFVVILLGDKVPRVSKVFAITSLGIFLLSILGITLGMYFGWTLRPNVGGLDAKFAQGMQGRYFTPLLVLLIAPFTYLQNYISINISRKTLTILAAAMAVFSLVVYLVLTYIFFYTSATGVKDILLK